MGATGFPGGITSPSIGGGWTAVPGEVFYVGNRSGLPSSNGKDSKHPFSTLNAALAKTVSNRGDAIRVLPGHIEDISTADQMTNLKAGTLIEGFGWGDMRGILRWSAAGATFLLDVAGVTIRNLRMQWAGNPAATAALTVAAPITVSGTGCRIAECDIDCGVDADQIITCGLAVGAAGFIFEDNTVHGATAAEITAAGTVIRLAAADRCIIRRNHISAALATDTDGVIETLTTASLDINISNNLIYSNGSGSTCALDLGQALACTGFLMDNQLVVDADGTAQTVVLTVSATANMAGERNFAVSNNNERGLVCLTATT